MFGATKLAKEMLEDIQMQVNKESKKAKELLASMKITRHESIERMNKAADKARADLKKKNKRRIIFGDFPELGVDDDEV